MQILTMFIVCALLSGYVYADYRSSKRRYVVHTYKGHRLTYNFPKKAKSSSRILISILMIVLVVLAFFTLVHFAVESAIVYNQEHPLPITNN